MDDRSNESRNFAQIASSSRFVGDLSVEPGGNAGASRTVSDETGILGGLYPPRSKAMPKPKIPSMHEAWSEELRKEASSSMRGLDAYSRHKKYINDYVILMQRSKEYLKKQESSIRHRNDWDVYEEGFQFIRSDQEQPATWEERLCRKYYERLFKEYCLADLSQYKKGKVGLRWRIHEEVVSGKGQFACGNIYCDSTVGLQSIETLFSYVENGEQKSALIKCRLCKECAPKLSYKTDKERKKRERKKQKKEENKKKKLKVAEKITEADVHEEKEEKVEKESVDVWKAPVFKQPSRNEQFDGYFEGLFP